MLSKLYEELNTLVPLHESKIDNDVLQKAYDMGYSGKGSETEAKKIIGKMLKDKPSNFFDRKKCPYANAYALGFNDDNEKNGMENYTDAEITFQIYYKGIEKMVKRKI
jgi:hypothetical protein